MKEEYGFINQEFCNLGEKPYKILGESVVTQARLSEPIRILEEEDYWYYVEMSDGYRGWVHSKNVEKVEEGTWHKLLESPYVLITRSFSPILSFTDPIAINGAVMATRIRLLGENVANYIVALPGGHAGLLSKKAGFIIPSFEEIPKGSYENIIRTGQSFIGLPYFWGGTTPYGFDCSGFVQTLFLMNGCKLPRDASEQYEFEGGRVVKDRRDLKKGDVVFFSTYAPGPSHVGIYIGNEEYIHSSGKTGVTINSFNPQAPNYREDLDKKYLGARRYEL